MNCNDVAAILDTHRSTRLSAAERATVDGHLTGCEDCAAAWHAQLELLGLPMPRVPATLLERALGAAHVPPRAQPRRAWPSIAVGTALLAGAALAGVTIVSLTRSPSVTVPSATGGEPSAPVAAGDVETAAAVSTAGADGTADLPTSVDLVQTSMADVVPLVRHNPQYPSSALEQRATGYVQLQFDITAAGTVENARVVKSDDARFEQSALEALSKWRYLPRLAAGKRVRSDGLQTIIRFALDNGKNPPAPRRQEEIDALVREQAAYSAGLEVALDRLARDDLRSVELQLDEMQAVHGAERLDLWNFYGYLYTVEGNYSRAIEAYETAVAVATRAQPQMTGPYVRLANLYFARHQYDLALKTLVSYRDRIAALQAANPERPARPLEGEAASLFEQLRALGVTEESLVGR